MVPMQPSALCTFDCTSPQNAPYPAGSSKSWITTTLGCGAAVVENASLPSQRVVRGPLAEIAAIAERTGVANPAAVIVGSVVRLT